MLLDCLVFIGWTTFALLFLGMAISGSRTLRWALSHFTWDPIYKFLVRASVVAGFAFYFATVSTMKIDDEAGTLVYAAMVVGFIAEYLVLILVPFGRPEAVELHEREPIMCLTTSADAREFRPPGSEVNKVLHWPR
jgi:hypothetical protein